MQIAQGERIKKFFRDKRISVPLGVAALIVIIAFSSFYINFLDSEGNLILHFNYRGEVDIIGSRYDVGVLVGIMALITLVNIMLSYALYAREQFLSYVISFATAWIILMGSVVIFAVASFN